MINNTMVDFVIKIFPKNLCGMTIVERKGQIKVIYVGYTLQRGKAK